MTNEIIYTNISCNCFTLPKPFDIKLTNNRCRCFVLLGMSTEVQVIIGLISSAVFIVISVLLRKYWPGRKQSVDTQSQSEPARSAHCCKCDKCEHRCSPVTNQGRGDGINKAFETQQSQEFENTDQLQTCQTCSSPMC